MVPTFSLLYSLMVHRPSDSRLLTSLFSNEKDCHKQLLGLLQWTTILNNPSMRSLFTPPLLPHRLPEPSSRHRRRRELCQRRRCPTSLRDQRRGVAGRAARAQTPRGRKSETSSDRDRVTVKSWFVQTSFFPHCIAFLRFSLTTDFSGSA